MSHSNSFSERHNSLQKIINYFEVGMISNSNPKESDNTSQMNNSSLNNMIERKRRKPGYWTKERVFAESHLYTTKKEFKEKSGTAYHVATDNGWLEEMTWIKSLPKGCASKWTEEKIITVSKKFSTIKEFRVSEPVAYKHAKKLNLIHTMIWLHSAKKENGYWAKLQDEELIDIGHNYSSKEEFRQKNNTAYKEASKRKLLDSMKWLQSRALWELKDYKIYSIYAYIDEDNKAAYIGLTRRKISQRNSEHRRIIQGKKSAVYKHFESVNKSIPAPLILEVELTPEQAQIQEEHYSTLYLNKGYKLLNNPHLTGLGKSSLGFYKTWTPDRVIEESKKYTSRSEFKLKNHSVYNAARTYHLLDRMTWLLPKGQPERRWPKAEVIKESKKYKHFYEFRKNAEMAYIKAKRNGWLSEMVWLDNEKPPKKIILTREYVFKLSHKVKSKIEFKTKFGSAYSKACSTGWIKEMTWLTPMRVTDGYWTHDHVIEASRTCKSRSEFAKKYNTAYFYARINGWIDEMTWLTLFTKPSGYWTKERVFEESKKYTSKKQFERNSISAYTKARKNKWLSEMTWLCIIYKE